MMMMMMMMSVRLMVHDDHGDFDETCLAGPRVLVGFFDVTDLVFFVALTLFLRTCIQFSIGSTKFCLANLRFHE